MAASLARCPAVGGELRPAVVGQGGACLPPVLGVWGAGGSQWFLHLSGETDILQALDLRVCQAVGALRPFLRSVCLEPGATWGLVPYMAASRL